MKKNLTIVMLLVVVLSLSGCGNSTSEEVNSEVSSNTATPVQEKDVVTKPTEEPSVTPEQTAEPVKELVPIEETLVIPEGVVNMHYKEDTTVKFGDYDSHDKIETYYTYEEYIPYYIGREHEESVNFIKNNRGENDEVLYLGLPIYLPNLIDRRTSYVEVDNPSIAKIEGEELIALKEGTFNLLCYDYRMELVDTKKFVSSTFNDSKGMKESYRTINGNSFVSYLNACEIDYWKDSVHTIMDMSFMLQARQFKYDFNKEPKFGYIENQINALDTWVWTSDAETIFDMSGGVCIQVAQLAVYMLADDYEDWGVIMVEGNQGHIFNWFYEDGNYYIFDFTEVISYNAWERPQSMQFSYKDFSSKVKTFSSVDGIKQWCKKEKVDLGENYAIYMYSCKGHDEIACNVNTGMSDSNACLRGDWEEITIGFQDVVMEDLIVLWENPNSCKINWESYSFEEMNPIIPCGIYNIKKDLVFRHEY